MKRPVEAAEAGLEEPAAGELLLLVGELHEQGDKLFPGKDEASFLAFPARRDPYGLECHAHAATCGST